MSSTLKTQVPQSILELLPIPDPWDFPLEEQWVPPTSPRIIPLDPNHQLSAAPMEEVILLGGLPDTLKLPERIGSGGGEIDILVEHELKLANQCDDQLRDSIRMAIAYLELIN